MTNYVEIRKYQEKKADRTFFVPGYTSKHKGKKTKFLV